MPSPRVVRIITRLNVGGPAQHVAWLQSGLQSSNWETLLLAGTRPPGEDDMSDFVRSCGVEWEVVPRMSRELSLRDLRAVYWTWRRLVRFQPDIVHTHTAKAGLVGRVATWLYRWATPGTLICRPRRCRLVHTYHGHVLHSYFGPVKTSAIRFLERLLARATDRIIVISPAQQAEIHGRFHVGREDQFRVIPLGIDLARFANAESRRRLLRDQLSVGNDEFLVGIVGRIAPVKNHELFMRMVESFQRVHAARCGREVRFVVVGDGPQRAALEDLAAELHVTQRVSFLGNRDDPEVFYSGLDALVLTSRNEGTPLSVIEAFAHGLPVVATRVGGVPDLVGRADDTGMDLPGVTLHERGLSTDSGDAVALAAAIAHLVDDAALAEQLGKRGAEFVQETASVDRLVHDIVELYTELCPSDRASGRFPPADCAADP